MFTEFPLNALMFHTIRHWQLPPSFHNCHALRSGAKCQSSSTEVPASGKERKNYQSPVGTNLPCSPVFLWTDMTRKYLLSCISAFPGFCLLLSKTAITASVNSELTTATAQEHHKSWCPASTIGFTGGLRSTFM